MRRAELNKAIEFVFLIALFTIVLLVVGGCGPSINQIKKAVNENMALPENYTELQDNPRVDRPVLVLWPVLEYEYRKNMKKSAGRSAAEKQQAEMQRNVIIRSLYNTRSFSQILPHDDPNDPSLPVDVLILETKSHHHMIPEARVDMRTGIMPQRIENDYIIKEPADGKSLKIHATVKTLPNPKTKKIEMSCLVDSGESFSIAIPRSDPELLSKMFKEGMDPMQDLISEVMVKKLHEQGY